MPLCRREKRPILKCPGNKHTFVNLHACSQSRQIYISSNQVWQHIFKDESTKTNYYKLFLLHKFVPVILARLKKPCLTKWWMDRFLNKPMNAWIHDIWLFMLDWTHQSMHQDWTNQCTWHAFRTKQWTYQCTLHTFRTDPPVHQSCLTEPTDEVNVPSIYFIRAEPTMLNCFTRSELNPPV